MSYIIKRIGFDDNKKCRICDLMGWYQVANSTFCDKHMEKCIKFHNRMVEYREQNR